jgi:RHS repeat-associated protein
MPLTRASLPPASDWGCHITTMQTASSYDCTPHTACPCILTASRYTGKERDTESGLDYFGARYLSSSMGRWMSPDVVNVTEDRMMYPSSTLNKYAYGADNPLKYIDPDGQDITIFYEPSNAVMGGSPGHTMLLAYNQQSGDSAIRSFGPDYANGATVLGTLVGTPGTDSFGFQNINSPDQLRANFASITIQTTPEEAQAVINEIRQHPDGNYSILSHNCTTTCSKLLRSIGKTRSHSLSPVGFFNELYAEQHGTNTGRAIRSFNMGQDYGNRRLGCDPFQLFFNDIPQQHEKVTSRIVPDSVQPVNNQ